MTKAKVTSSWGKTPNRIITERDKKAANRLAAIWNAKRKHLGLTQTIVAEQWGWTQSAVSQYLAGSVALNTDAIMKIARTLKVHPKAIDAEWFGPDLPWTDIGIDPNSFNQEPDCLWIVSCAGKNQPVLATFDGKQFHFTTGNKGPVDNVAYFCPVTPP